MADDGVTLLGRLKSKLIDSKQKWAEDGRLLTGKTAVHAQRLPPGQRKVENWPVLDLGIQPEIPLHAWRLFVDGAVEHPMDWKWGETTPPRREPARLLWLQTGTGRIRRMLFSNRVRATIADGADGIFQPRAHPDHSAGAAFTTKGNVDADPPKKGLRPTAGESAGIFGPAGAVGHVSGLRAGGSHEVVKAKPLSSEPCNVSVASIHRD
jgi:hypothetical protein